MTIFGAFVAVFFAMTIESAARQKLTMRILAECTFICGRPHQLDINAPLET